jgi:tRNA-dihydrouridine synthase 2
VILWNLEGGGGFLLLVMVMEMGGRIGRGSDLRLVSPILRVWMAELMLDADSVMLARAAEKNPSVFLPAGPRCNVTEIVPKLLHIAQYTQNPWGNTKFLLNQFKPSPPPISTMPKAQKKEHQEIINKAKSIEELAAILLVDLSKAKEVMSEVERKIKERQADAEEKDVFEERKEKEDAGEVVDEPEESEGIEKEAQVDGFQVGVGQAETGSIPSESAPLERVGGGITA